MKLFSGSVAIAIAATALAAPANAATPAPPTKIAGDWIVGELTDGLAIGDYGADIGLTVDAGLALDAIGHSADAGAIGDAIAPALVTSEGYPYGYVRSDENDGEGRYANATAKAAAFTQRIGRDAGTAYSEVDLLAQLEELTSDATGQIADDSIYGDYANTIGQSFAVEALAVAGSTEAEAAAGALLNQQCPAGYFRLTLKSAGCADDADAPNPDVTALAVISLIESGSTSSAVSGAVADAADWLESVQQADGSLEGDAWTPGSNTNSTGLAGWALGKAGRTVAAAEAAAWARSMQVADAGACATLAPTGGIAYNAGDLAEARDEGVTLKRDAWRRATFQAAPALLWAPAAGASLGIMTPATAAEKGIVQATVSGLAAGEHGCVALGSTARPVTGTGDELIVEFELPAGPGAHTFSVTTLGGTQSSTTTVPAPEPTPTSTPTSAPTSAPTSSTTPVAPVVGQLVAGKTEKVKNNAFKVAVTCDGSEVCTGKLKVRTKRTVKRANGTTPHLLIAKKEYSVEPGETARITLKLTRPARAVLGSRRLRVEAVQTARGAESSSARFWLRRK